MMLNELRVLYYDRLYPEKSGGYYRTLNIAKLASSNFYRTCVFATDERIQNTHTEYNVQLYQDIKYANIFDKYFYYIEGLFFKNFSLKVSQKAFDHLDNALIQIEGPYFYNSLKCKNVKKYVLDEHNVYWELQDFPVSDTKNKIFNGLTKKRNKQIEIEAIKNASHILACSKRDKQIIIDNVPDAEHRISVIPNCVNYDEYTDYQVSDPAIFDAHKSYQVLFLGLLSYYPNLDAIYNICNRIAPKFKNDVKFIIVGKDPPDIKKTDNVAFAGYVDDLKKCILQSDICIAPLRYGSGTRFKILEYMAMGKPVISTTKGAEGIDYTSNKDIIIEDEIDRYNERISELICNHHKRHYIGQNARELVRQKYDWKIYEPILNDVYQNVID